MIIGCEKTCDERAISIPWVWNEGPGDLQGSEPRSGWVWKKRQEIIEHIFDERVILDSRRDEGLGDLQTSEPLSGWASKRQWDMDHTLVKGRQKVETEYRLAAICYNLTRVVSLLGIEGLKKRLIKLQKGLFLSILGLPGTMKRYITNCIENLMSNRRAAGPIIIAHKSCS